MLRASVPQAFVRRLLPLRCVVCGLHDGRPNIPVCAECEHDFFSATAVRCTRCAIRVSAATDAAPVCGRCLADKPHFDATTTLADYLSPVDGMVMALKFTARLDLANCFGRLLAERVAAIDDVRNAMVVAVPLAFERVRQRGFNQSHQIARAFASAGPWELAPDWLRRVRHTLPQQSLALTERRRNVQGAFAVEGGVAGRSLLVVDDVMTTGSTLNEIARVLKRAGAARVHNVVAARTP